MKEYSWDIVTYENLDPNDVGKEFEKLGDNLTPKAVVDVARDPNNIMHNVFEWNDTIAAERFRISQANSLIRNLKVIIKNDDKDKKIKTRAFVTLKKNTTFQPIEEVVKDVDKYQILLDKAYTELYAIKMKYENLSEIQDLLKDIPEKF